jgi:outer membrane protein, heavy metal efflux system
MGSVMKKPIFPLLVLSLAVSAAGQDALSLDEAVRVALRDNPSLLKARKEMDAAAGRLLQSAAYAPPEIDFSWNEIPSSFNLAESVERSIGVSQAVEFPGKRSSRMAAAGWDLRIRGEALRREEMRVTAAVRRAYLAASLSGELAGHADEALALLRQFQRIAELRFETGSVPYLDLLRVKMEISGMENRISDLKRNQRKSLSDLSRLLYLPDSAGVTLSDGLTYKPAAQTLEEALVRLSADRPSVKIADAEAEQSRALTSLARKSWLPDFSLGLHNLTLKEQPPFNANRYHGTTATNNWELDFGISVPIWFRSRQKGEIMAARSAERIAEISRLEVRRNLAASIRNSRENVKTAEEQVVRFRGSTLRDCDDAIQSARTLYQNGQLDVLNLLDTYRMTLETRSEYLSALYRYNVALVDLELAGEEPVEWGERHED